MAPLHRQARTNVTDHDRTHCRAAHRVVRHCVPTYTVPTYHSRTHKQTLMTTQQLHDRPWGRGSERSCAAARPASLTRYGGGGDPDLTGPGPRRPQTPHRGPSAAETGAGARTVRVELGARPKPDGERGSRGGEGARRAVAADGPEAGVEASGLRRGNRAGVSIHRM